MILTEIVKVLVKSTLVKDRWYSWCCLPLCEKMEKKYFGIYPEEIGNEL